MTSQAKSIITKTHPISKCPRCGGRMFIEIAPEIWGGVESFCVQCGYRNNPEPLPYVSPLTKTLR